MQIDPTKQVQSIDRPVFNRIKKDKKKVEPYIVINKISKDTSGNTGEIVGFLNLYA